MNYLMLVCSDGEPIPAGTDVGAEIDVWIERCGTQRIYGEPLAPPDQAKTVRVRNAMTLISDGPYAETKEFIAGFDLLTCADLDAAVTLAAAHPIARFRSLELRPFPTEVSLDGAAEALAAAVGEPGERFLLMFCVDGIPEAEAVEAAIHAQSRAWGEQQGAADRLVFGSPLQPADTATTVRVRDGQTLLSDGPFVETKEFLAGIAILRCADRDEAVALAAAHPLAAFHRVEVRPFPEA
ncbi:YciI family protein [Conexibacter sp. DBS9H8]|uniref:YciI family protein n=1 Tax=Conexibacter sp. DBS9H8 TaxID=2937801 RepID=UPI002010714B|nr:YciI family protein [Conexibacter sp. DBS9H8]